MSNDTSRRDFLITLGSGAAMGLIAPPLAQAFDGPAPAPGALRTRRNVADATAAKDLESLRRGVAEMKKLIASRPTDPRGWILQSYIHGNCGGFTKCQHNNWFFAPWHRVYLYYFEQLIQYFSGDQGFALPYWNWTRTHVVPDSFYGDNNSLNDTVSIRSSCSSAPTAGRGREQGSAFSQDDLDTYVGSTVIAGIQNNPDFASYGGANPGRGELEATPHNFVHRWVGAGKRSNMVQYFSPLDPIFWMHHCNIDRLYSDWLSRPGHKPPSDDPAWRDRSFNDFYDPAGRPAGAEWTCGKTVDSRVMGYVYDSVVPLPKAMLERVARTPRVVQTIAASAAAVRDGVLTLRSEAAPPQEARLKLNAAAAAPRHYAVRLTLLDLKTPANQNTGIHVFLGDIAADTPLTAPGYVGSFTYFDGEGGDRGGGHHGRHGVVILDASEAFQNLYGEAGVPEAQSLTVSLRTEDLYQGVEGHASVEEVQPSQVRIEVLDLGG